MNKNEGLSEDGFVVSGEYTGKDEELYFMPLPNSRFCWRCAKTSFFLQISKLPLLGRLFRWVSERTIDGLGFTPASVVIKRKHDDTIDS